MLSSCTVKTRFILCRIVANSLCGEFISLSGRSIKFIYGLEKKCGLHSVCTEKLCILNGELSKKEFYRLETTVKAWVNIICLR